MTSKTETETEFVCQYRGCGKSLEGRRKQTKYCDATCRTAALTTTIDEKTGEERPLRISFGCSYPTAGTAEILKRDQARRHPYEGNRPKWSGYCVDKQCECHCHDEVTE